MTKPPFRDIFRFLYPAYLESILLLRNEAKVARNILNCKTGAYGANVSVCEDCGAAVQIHYNSNTTVVVPCVRLFQKETVDGCPQRGCS